MTYDIAYQAFNLIFYITGSIFFLVLTLIALWHVLHKGDKE